MPRFTREQHVRSGRDFAAIYAERHRAGDDTLLVFARRRSDDARRIGLSVSRKNGPAVRRNRIKRRLREAFRLSQSQLPTGYDWVLVPRPGTDPTLAEYRRSLERLTAKLDRRLRKQAAADPR